MKVYVMYCAWGSYEDYGKAIKGVYLNEDNCKKAVEKYNEHLKHKKEMLKQAEDMYNDICEQHDFKTDWFGSISYEDEEIVKSEMGELYKYHSYNPYQYDDAHNAWMESYEIKDALI